MLDHQTTVLKDDFTSELVKVCSAGSEQKHELCFKMLQRTSLFITTTVAVGWLMEDGGWRMEDGGGSQPRLDLINFWC